MVCKYSGGIYPQQIYGSAYYSPVSDLSAGRFGEMCSRLCTGEEGYLAECVGRREGVRYEKER
jgi:hypothetical protein